MRHRPRAAGRGWAGPSSGLAERGKAQAWIEIGESAVGMGLARRPPPRSGWAAGVAWGPGKAWAEPGPTRKRAGGGR